MLSRHVWNTLLGHSQVDERMENHLHLLRSIYASLAIELVWAYLSRTPVFSMSRYTNKPSLFSVLDPAHHLYVAAHSSVSPVLCQPALEPEPMEGVMFTGTP